MNLRELREARGIKQTKLARKLGTVQSTISKLENRSDGVSLKTLRSWIEALGGCVSVKAVFPEGETEINF